jgi:anaerobic dimethyl sulfoxide reductase subunit B (iron-sulfur subunit)
MWAATLSIACNHCDTPACMAVCPTGAIQKDTDTGLVVIDQTVCNGCQTCVTACPYGEPVYFADNNIVNKCDGCIDKVRNGEMPSCVAACSTRCLMFGEADDLRSTYSSQGGTSDLPVLPSSSMTGPNFIIMPVQGMVSQG